MNAHVMDANAFVPEIEQNVLGAILLGGDIHETLSILKEHHFVEAFHREVYRAALAAHERYGVNGGVKTGHGAEQKSATAAPA